MKIIISGASGLVGTALRPLLEERGHRVSTLGRTTSATPRALSWDPLAGELEPATLSGCDVVIHLAGENIGDGRWTKAKKSRIRASRAHGTRLLSEVLAELSPKPQLLISASAIGIYGDRGRQQLTEESELGTGFLANVCQEWEAATRPARDAGIRVVNARFGVVLSASGGALARMLTPFKFGLGGIVGSGDQYMSWISRADAVSAIAALLDASSLEGPVNVMSPYPVTNRHMTKALGRAIGNPTILPLPAFIARIVMGEMADALLLCSARSVPQKLTDHGFSFQHPHIEQGLEAALTDR